MSPLRLDPFSLGTAYTGLFAFVAGAYLLGVRGKSKATWAFIAYCLFVAAQTGSVAFGFWTTDIVALDLRFFLSPAGAVYVASTQLVGVALIQVAYYFIVSPMQRESRVTLVVTTLVSACVTIWSMIFAPRTPILVVVPLTVISAFTVWALVVALRKAMSASATRRQRQAFVALAIFLTVSSAASILTNLWSIAAGFDSVAMEIATVMIIFINSLALLIVYVQYSPEPTTFHVKLVGYAFVFLLAVFGSTLRILYSQDNMRADFAPAPPPMSIQFVPDSSGEYSISSRLLTPPSPVPGANIGIERDDQKVRYDLPFAFPFAGDSVSTVWVDSNGAIEPVLNPNPSVAFTQSIASFGSYPVIAVYFADLTPGFDGGFVGVAASQDSVTITWSHVRPFQLFSSVTVQAVLHKSGQITFNYIDIPSDLTIGAVGIVPSSVSRSAMVSTVDDLLSQIAGGATVALIDRQGEYKIFVHNRIMPFVWISIVALAVLLFLSPLFYHASLVAPLRRVLRGVRSVNDGNLDVEVDVGVRDEIGHLAENFNGMTQSLRKYANEMEGLVAERTRDLEASLETIKQAQAQLVQAEKLASLGQMTAGIAHEIKNPLNFVNNFAELNDELFAEFEEAVARGEPVDDLLSDLKTNTRQIAAHGKRADTIVGSMLQHAHAGERTVEHANVNKIVDEYTTLAFHSAKSRMPDFDIDLQRAFDPSAGEAKIATSEIGRVLINLIGNAFDAITEFGGSTVTVSTRGSADEVEIRVTDDGPGIPADVRSHIFEPFFTTKPTGSGTGLGLSLSYDIVTAGHGGSLVVESVEGEGATFVVTLPRGDGSER